jgi:hypothetical protein
VDLLFWIPKPQKVEVIIMGSVVKPAMKVSIINAESASKRL